MDARESKEKAIKKQVKLITKQQLRITNFAIRTSKCKNTLVILERSLHLVQMIMELRILQHQLFQIQSQPIEPICSGDAIESIYIGNRKRTNN